MVQAILTSIQTSAQDRSTSEWQRMAKDTCALFYAILEQDISLNPPTAPHYNSLYDQNMGVQGDPPYSGGEIEAHAQAQEDAWPKIIAFLRRNVPQVKCSL
ncbi:acyl-coenzyme A thioesterase [Desmophyllum pertusum]|uniref:Acyl-coenzyme A thioesterase n=1 Tax=Desmophyllum pertusum TaxID=174260 RepID=A0A9W9ZLB6_9CNID|nr:acyl-coenzyme A thioesterase [Desmophyllum pertusum]